MSKNSKSTDKILDEREAEHAIKNYTRVPNMLVDGYKDLHPQDKWLYVCLVRLCGKEGTRYLSLRYIAERTGFSPSVLSDDKKREKPGMIHRLHNAGLIHAEIKRRHTSDGKEEKNAQYHITVTDTWKLNYDFFYGSATCSESEQDSKEPVLNQNATCSESEQDKGKPVLIPNKTCSDSGTIVILQNKITDSSKITEVRDSNPTSSTPQLLVAKATPSPSLSSLSLFSEETKPKAPSKTKTEEPKGPPEIPPIDASWPSRETAVQIVEAKKGRAYSSATRKQELAEAGKVLEMTINGALISREQFEYAWDELASSGWWEEHGKPPMIKYLRRDDSIITILNKRSKKGTSSSSQRTAAPSTHGTASHDGYTKQERLDLFKMTQEERKMYNQRRREERERNAVASASYSSQA